VFETVLGLSQKYENQVSVICDVQGIVFFFSIRPLVRFISQNQILIVFPSFFRRSQDSHGKNRRTVHPHCW
jgi:uncharacterized membrane protein YqiK